MQFQVVEAKKKGGTQWVLETTVPHTSSAGFHFEFDLKEQVPF
jgi:hypothetical protein